MTLQEQLRVQKILRVMAYEQGCTTAQIRHSIQEAIDEAWSNTWNNGDVAAQQHWQLIFPDGRKPTVDQFIVALAKRAASG